MTAYPRTKFKGSGYVKTSIRNGKVFELEWLDLVGPTPTATKAVLQAEYGTREKRVRKICINLKTAYGLVIGKCTNYLQSCFEGQDKQETMSNKHNLLELLKSVKSLLHKYDKYMEYHHVAYHTLLRRFML